MRAKRRRISLIVSLVDSLQQDKKLEENKSEENKKGKQLYQRLFAPHFVVSLGPSRVEFIGEILSFLSAGYGSNFYRSCLIHFSYE